MPLFKRGKSLPKDEQQARDPKKCVHPPSWVTHYKDDDDGSIRWFTCGLCGHESKKYDDPRK